MNPWTTAELQTMHQMRSRFLSADSGLADYWKSRADLALYDETFAERIGWKWDTVLLGLVSRGWAPRSHRVLDWACGTGVAGRRVIERWPQLGELALHDRSASAVAFAAERARAEHPALRVSSGNAVDAETLLVVSHVINELSPRDLARLVALARQAGEILWIESGTHAASRRLIESVREPLRDTFQVVAPCTHCAGCGMLQPENAHHWCHHFATVPSEVFQSARWATFSRELGIDLRALPYSFLVLQRPRELPPTPPGCSRVIGRPRRGKGHDKVLSCQADGLREFVLQKRDAPKLMRALHKGTAAPIHRWELRGDRIIGDLL